MTGWLIVNEYLNTEKFLELQELFMAAAKIKNIELIKYTNAEFAVSFGAVDRTAGDDSRATECLNILAISKAFDNGKPDFVIFYDKDIMLAKAFENMGIKVFNSAEAIKICDSKVETALAVSNWNAYENETIHTPRTYKLPFTYENIGIGENAKFDFLDIIESEIGYPLIIKESYSSFGMGVHLAGSREEAIELLCKYGNKECLIQEYIHIGTSGTENNAISETGAVDVRLQMVGDKCVAAMMRNNDSDYRANITNGGVMSQYEPTKADLELAVNVMKCLKLDFAGIDIMFARNNESRNTIPVFCEANSNAHFKNLYDLTGINTAEYMLDYIKDKCRENNDVI